jgi:methionyl-tRNA formyltransferase
VSGDKTASKRGGLVFAGCVDAGYFCAERLIEAGITPSAILSLDAEMAVKAKVSGYRSFFDLPVDCERRTPLCYSMKSQEDVAYFEERRFDLLVVLGWQRLVPDEIIRTLRLGGLTIHGSGPGLPKGRGRSPMNWALVEGFKEFRLSLLGLGEGADNGAIYDTMPFDILPCDDIRTLYYKNAMLSAKMLVKNIPGILSGEVKGVPQDDSLATYYPKRTPEDGRLDWTAAASTVERLVRAVAKPYPGAFTHLGDARITVWKAQVFDTHIKSSGRHGLVAAVFPDGAFLVECSDLLELILEYDGPRPSAGDILR